MWPQGGVKDLAVGVVINLGGTSVPFVTSQWGSICMFFFHNIGTIYHINKCYILTHVICNYCGIVSCREGAVPMFWFLSPLRQLDWLIDEVSDDHKRSHNPWHLFGRDVSVQMCVFLSVMSRRMQAGGCDRIRAAWRRLGCGLHKTSGRLYNCSAFDGESFFLVRWFCCSRATVSLSI